QTAGIRGIPAVIVKVVLDGLDGAEPELVGTLRQPQYLVEVLGGRQVGGPEGRKEVEPESHKPTGRMKADSLLAVNQEAAGAGLRRALHERAVFHQDDAGLGGAPCRLG